MRIKLCFHIDGDVALLRLYNSFIFTRNYAASIFLSQSCTNKRLWKLR